MATAPGLVPTVVGAPALALGGPPLRPIGSTAAAPASATNASGVTPPAPDWIVTACVTVALDPPLSLTVWPVNTSVVDVPSASVTVRLTW